jgi:alanyl-tRNA synthetase
LRFPETEYHVPFFDEYGYVRKLCPRCGEYFWTQRPEQELCGESTAEGCAEYTFIGDPATRKAYSLEEMREAFLSFFEKRGHERISPYPIVARWRDDLYFTNASIIDFQPYVTEGMIPPPANPLVISQPCVRFPDLDNVAPTFGRHDTIFEMGGHHAFNYPGKEVYWKDGTVRYHHEFLTKELGVKSDEVVYKEGVWSGGGNAGPDVEGIVRGLEVDTLVFMKYKVVDGEYVELPIRTVDTGYGIERYTWISRGTVSCFHAVYGDLLEKIMDMAGMEPPDNRLLAEVSKVSGLMSISKTSSRAENLKKIAKKVGVNPKDFQLMMNPIFSLFAVTDHTKCLAFLLAEGVVPSNIREGYLTRLLIRRTYRFLKSLSIEDKMPEIIDLQIARWSKAFPLLKDMRNEVLELLAIEKEKYEQTLQRGGELTRRIVGELKAKGADTFPVETLVELYDSHGLPPEVVSEMAAAEGTQVTVPENFYGIVAERHIEAPKTLKTNSSKGSEELENEVSSLPATRPLYYEDAYVREFKAKVLYASGNRVVLDRTNFYPEGGGQPADHGCLEFDGTRSQVLDVKKVNNVIVHFVEGAVPEKGAKVKGSIDWERRISLMRHHTATHLVNGAARRILGRHVWQAGAQKDVDKTRLDISHPKRLTNEEVYAIEKLANEAVMRNLTVETLWMPRQEAEREYGFRLYQGGVVPGREIRVVKTGDWEVEACGGTHCKSTGEIGLIKIIRTERIQDGVERITFSAGVSAVKAVQEIEAKLLKAADLLAVPSEKVENTLERMVNEWKELRRDKEHLTETLAKFMAEKYLLNAKEVSGLKIVSQIVDAKDADVDLLIKVSNELAKSDQKTIAVFIKVGTDAKIVARVGEEAGKRGVDAREITREAAAELGGGGSGRPEFAQGGGTRVGGAPRALQKAEEIIRRKIGG